LSQFVFFTFLTCPPNFLWQQYLEETFPGYITEEDGSQSLHKINTAKKFALDQTLGGVVNTVAFIAFFAALSGKDSLAIQRAVRRVCRAHLIAVSDTHSSTGHAAPHASQLETLASSISPQLHCGPHAPADTGGLGGRSLLGHLSVTFRRRIVSLRDMLRDSETKKKPHHVERLARDTVVRLQRHMGRFGS
jgi:hypothetical protein